MDNFLGIKIFGAVLVGAVLAMGRFGIAPLILQFSSLLCPDRREGGNKRCFCPSVCRLSVHLSGCPSVAYIANNSRTQKPSVPKFEMKVPHLRCDSHTSFNVKRSKVRATQAGGDIPCRPNPAATLLVIVVNFLLLSYYNYYIIVLLLLLLLLI